MNPENIGNPANENKEQVNIIASNGDWFESPIKSEIFVDFRLFSTKIKE